LSKKQHKIVLTTARNEKFREQLITLLDNKNIVYDELIMSCKSGPRVLINDKKPKKRFTTQANSFEIYRNTGLKEFDISHITDNNNIEIIKNISSNSFAETYILKRKGDLFVRKVVSKKHGEKHVNTLKRQKADMERFNFLCNDICPNVLDEGENNLEYYYDMDFLKGYKELSCFKEPIQIEVLKKLIKNVKKTCYSMSKELYEDIWMNDFLNSKIYPKFDSFSLLNDQFNTIINKQKIVINEKSYYGLRATLDLIDKTALCPKKICVIHGDLTLENIMYNGNQDTKLIDMDGSRIFDARELDLGKLSQSIVSRYDLWKDIEGYDLVEYNDSNEFNITEKYTNFTNSDLESCLIDLWTSVLNESNTVVKKKIIFFMSTYFIRFVPFRLRKHTNHGLFALLMAVIWLNKLLGEQDEN
jgi:thiamine kinase-like enzyme